MTATNYPIQKEFYFNQKFLNATNKEETTIQLLQVRELEIIYWIKKIDSMTATKFPIYNDIYFNEKFLNQTNKEDITI